MSELINRASELLRQMYDAERGLFSYSTRVVDGGYQNDFSHPKAQRYTINTLAGLWKLEQSNPGMWDAGKAVDLYLEHQQANITDPGDHGLLLYVLSQGRHGAAGRQFAIVKGMAGSESSYRAQVLQDACWQLYGLIGYAMRYDSDEAHAMAANCFRWLQQYFMDAETLFPCHQSQGMRKRFVSFGGITYFLKALYEYATACDDDRARELFEKGVRAIIARQGPQGEWAWFYDARTGRVVDWYEVYSVHQEAMAMLFLLPAVDLGVQGARAAVEKSVAWLFGANELNAPIMVREPFFSYRSIRRRGPLQRQKRIARAMTRAATGRAAQPASPATLEINKECRSYEMGWTVYAWAGREDFPEFTGLQAL